MLTVENIGNRIYVFYKETHKEITNFKPYFYYENEEGEYTSLFGKRLKKVEVDSPKDVPQVRDNYLNHHEADIPFNKRYIIDKFDKIEKEEFRKFYLDIELEEAADVETTKSKINLIGFFDNQTKKIYQLAVPPKKIEKRKEIKRDNIRIILFPTEKEMLKGFIKCVQYFNPNIICAWFGDGFDYPYILNRMNKLGLNPNLLSPINQSYCMKNNTGRWNIKVKGRVLIDLMYVYKTISQGQRESFSLDYISNYELGEGKEKYEGNLSELYSDNFEKFLSYNLQDIKLLIKLDEKLKLIDTFDAVRRVAHCNFEDCYHNSRILDSYLLYVAKKLNIVLPSKGKHEKIKFTGAYVKEPTKGLHSNVAVFDLKSLYPNIMRTFNLSPETIDKNGNINIDDKFRFSNIKKGLIPLAIDTLLKNREKKKEERNKYEKDSIEYRALDMIQYSYKVIPNSLYGVLGSPYFRLFKHEVAASVTHMGQRIIKHSINFLEDKGFEVVASDTDSVFCKIGDKSYEECEEIAKKITEEYDKFVKQFGIEEHTLEMEFEKVYKRLLFVENASGKVVKKRYAGLINNEIEIKGFESRRSDSPQIIRDWQKELFEKILRREERIKIIHFVENFKTKFFELKEELGIPTGINSKAKKTTPIHIRAANLSNNRHGTNFGIGDKIKWLYVKKCPSQYTFENVIAFQNSLPQGYLIDYNKMWNRLCQKKIVAIFSSIDWNMEKTKSLFGEW